MTTRPLNRDETIIMAQDLRTLSELQEVVQLLLDHLNLDLVEEATPDYTGYSLMER